LDRRYYSIDYDTLSRAWTLASNAAIEVIGKDNRSVVFMASPVPEVLTYELITMHLLFERGYSLTFVPLVNNL
jgi:hypothetical protein